VRTDGKATNPSTPCGAPLSAISNEKCLRRLQLACITTATAHPSSRSPWPVVSLRLGRSFRPMKIMTELPPAEMKTSEQRQTRPLQAVGRVHLQEPSSPYSAYKWLMPLGPAQARVNDDCGGRFPLDWPFDDKPCRCEK
jgi:hypothetical protein